MPSNCHRIRRTGRLSCDTRRSREEDSLLPCLMSGPPTSKRCSDGWAGGFTIHGSRREILSNGRRLATLRRDLPTLIRKLIYASNGPQQSRRASKCRAMKAFNATVGTASLTCRTKSLFVPAGVSGWEISVEQRPANKAERDFKARKKGPLGLPPSEVTFVFVTSRKWDGKQKWRDEKRELRQMEER